MVDEQDRVESSEAAAEPGTPLPDFTVLNRQRDPLVGALWITILVIIILALVTAVYAMVAGVFGTGAPRTSGDAKVVSTAAKVEAGSTDPEDWRAYILALIETRQYRRAQEWIDRGTKTLEDQEISADMLYMQAELELAQGDADQALETADEALNTIKTTYDEAKAEMETTGRTNKAAAFGISANYGELLLLKAEVYVDREEWESALAAYDGFLAENKTAATVFTQRGEVKEKLGDNAGAEADYRATLVFIADHPEALEGLERIGASE
ncbi:MAG: hypothetical protein CVT69_00845 [Actinobacteria bacterium HGW-Actinobacteria-9]|nr:MAG: hypothetical protein CVT69_00845 [Actinobacteria bacterium HGW-Actinobacteria-9]